LLKGVLIGWPVGYVLVLAVFLLGATVGGEHLWDVGVERLIAKHVPKAEVRSQAHQLVYEQLVLWWSRPNKKMLAMLLGPLLSSGHHRLL
jgi:hypothetical protein